MLDEFKKFLFRGGLVIDAVGGEPVEDTPAPSDEALLLTEIRDLLRQRAS